VERRSVDFFVFVVFCVAKDEALAYPDFSKEFEVYTDGSSSQI
jgi:hypothetical protein